MDVAKNSLGLPLLNDLDDLFMDYVEGLENLAGELPLLDMDNLSGDTPTGSGGALPSSYAFPDFGAFDPALAGVFSLDEFQKPAKPADPAPAPVPAVAPAPKSRAAGPVAPVLDPKAKSSSPSGGFDWMDDEEEDGGEDGGAGAGGRRGRSAHGSKSVKQQVLNKQAQKRYRERKKEKAAQMETTIQILTQQLEDMKNVQRAHEALMHRNAALEQALKDRETEMLRMQLAGTEALEAGAPAPAVPLPTLLASAPSEGGAGGESPCSEIPSINCKRLSMLFQSQVDELSKFLSDKSIDPDHVDCSQSLECPVLCKELYQRIDLICQTCACVARAEGKDIESLLGINLASHGSLELSTNPDGNHGRCAVLWSNIVRSLNLSREQTEASLHVRKIYFEKINKLFAERQALNKEALRLLVPYAQETAARISAEAEDGAPNSASFVSLLMRSQQCSEVARLLDALKVNLREEQKLTSEAEYLVCRRVLRPLQAAKVIKNAYPYFCDVFALLEATHLVYGPGAEGREAA